MSIKPACMPTWDTVDAKVDADVIEARASYGVTVVMQNGACVPSSGMFPR